MSRERGWIWIRVYGHMGIAESMMLVTYAGAPLELVNAPRQEALGEKRLCGSHDGQTKGREKC